MRTHKQSMAVEKYIATFRLRSLFNKKQSHIQSGGVMNIDSVLSEIHNKTFFNMYIGINAISDLVFYQTNIPPKFLILELLTFLLIIIPYVIMVLDSCFSWTALSKFSYFFASLCGAVLFITVLIAKKEWMDFREDGKV